MITVTGGTGFVGRHLVTRLLARGEQVRVLARRHAEIPGADTRLGDVRDQASVVAAARGSEAVVHLVGIIRERGGSSFQQVHVEGTRTVVRACKEAGVARLIHMSALGARPGATSRYHRSKWEAEELVRRSELAATIFRPSVIFGEGNTFLPELRRLVKWPVVPIVGSGMGLLQPIWIEDVVSCFVGALGGPATIGRTYELGGPQTYGFEQLVEMVAEAAGLEMPKLHLPVALARMAAALGRLLPNFPLTADQLKMLLEDNVCDIGEMCEVFGIRPAFLRDHLTD